MSQVDKLLKEKNVDFIVKGNDCLVKCLNPEHEDTAPSMRIDRDTGQFHCFSCGFKGTSIFKFFNRTQDIVTSRVNMCIDNLRKVRYSSAGYPLPKDAQDWDIPWRGISTETLREFGAFTSASEFPERIVFPITTDSGKVVACNGRYSHSDASPKYLIKPKKAELPLYPFVKTQHLVIVEGLFDVINLHEHDFKHAVCSFGTSTISYDTVYDKLLPYIIAGTRYITILYDGDVAGSKAAERLQKIIEIKTDLTVGIETLPDGKDPGDLSRDEVNYLKNRLNNKFSF